jgi:hypothetical protein
MAKLIKLRCRDCGSEFDYRKGRRPERCVECTRTFQRDRRRQAWRANAEREANGPRCLECGITLLHEAELCGFCVEERSLWEPLAV